MDANTQSFEQVLVWYLYVSMYIYIYLQRGFNSKHCTLAWPRRKYNILVLSRVARRGKPRKRRRGGARAKLKHVACLIFVDSRHKFIDWTNMSIMKASVFIYTYISIRMYPYIYIYIDVFIVCAILFFLIFTYSFHQFR